MRIREVKSVPLRPPKTFKRLPFAALTGNTVCWKLDVPPERFAELLAVPGALALRSHAVRVFFPVFDRYYVVKKFRSADGFTLFALLAAVHKTAVTALAYYVRDAKLADKPTLAQVTPLLRQHTACELHVARGRAAYHVYVA